MRIALVTAPYHLGHEGVSVGAGPDRLLDEGAVEALEEAGHEVDVVRVVPQAGSTNEIGASFEIVRRVSEAVSRAVEDGAFPIVLSGNCLSSIGIVAGLGRDVGIVWLDAHADFNTPDELAERLRRRDGPRGAHRVELERRSARPCPATGSCPRRTSSSSASGTSTTARHGRLDGSQLQVVAPDGAVEAIGPALGRAAGPRRGRLPARRPRRARPVGRPSRTSTRRRTASRPTPSSRSSPR